jgi:hypothetical protein
MGDFRPLSCNFLPLKKYNPIKILCYDTKEISVIKLTFTIYKRLSINYSKK